MICLSDLCPEPGASERALSVQGIEQSTGPDVLEDLYTKQSRRMKTAQETLAAKAGQD